MKEEILHTLADIREQSPNKGLDVNIFIKHLQCGVLIFKFSG